MKNINLNDRKILAITGEFIKAKRKQLNYCHNGIAKEINTSQPVVSKIEHGEYKGLKYAMLYHILHFLNTSMSELEEYILQQSAGM